MTRSQINGVMPHAALIVSAETLAACLTTAVIAKPVAEGAETGVPDVSVADADGTNAEAPRPAVAQALGDSSMSVVAAAKQWKNMVVGDSTATRNCCSHCLCPSTLFYGAASNLAALCLFIKPGIQLG